MADAPELLQAPTVTLRGKALAGVLALRGAVKVTGPQTVRLGCLASTLAERRSVPVLGDYLRKTAWVPPVESDWTEKSMESLSRMYANDQYGCCVISGKYHLFGVWTGNEAESTVTVDDTEVLSTYQAWKAGPGDSGCIIVDVLRRWRTQGLPVNGVRQRIEGFAAGDHTRVEQVKTGVHLFGGAAIGINLPEEWTTADTWDITNSPMVGGHDVEPVGYDTLGVYVSSWGRVYLMTWRAFTDRRYVTEIYYILGPQWYEVDGIAPSGLDVAKLREDLSNMPDNGGGGPPPGPTPGRLFSLTFTGNVPRGAPVRFNAPVAIPMGRYDVVGASSGATVTADE